MHVCLCTHVSTRICLCFCMYVHGCLCRCLQAMSADSYTPMHVECRHSKERCSGPQELFLSSLPTADHGRSSTTTSEVLFVPVSCLHIPTMFLIKKSQIRLCHRKLSQAVISLCEDRNKF